MKVLDLFSGIGGFSLGLERMQAFETAAFCEIDPFCRRVLAKHWSGVPCYDNIRTLTSTRLTKDGIGAIDLICGGFPCQPHSVAGKRRGSDDERDLWPEFARTIREVRPQRVLAENVPGILSTESGRFFGQILRDLAALGFDAEWHCIRASDVSAPHRRDRIGLLPTPTASDWKGPNFSGSGSASCNGLATAVGGQLNPEFVEWIMGLPIGRTDLKR
jgi:DNA (cytosine-5)-methyltransferase 1